MSKYDNVSDVNPGGQFLLNCPWSDEELDEKLPAKAKRYIAQNNIQFYTCDASRIATEIGLGSTRTNTVLQSAFFKITGIIPEDKAVESMKEAIRKTYGRKGQKIVDMNCEAVDRGVTGAHKVNVPESWKNAQIDRQQSRKTENPVLCKYLNDVLVPTSAQKGDDIPVSKFLATKNGILPSGTSAFERRGVAASVPVWIKENCVECNICSYVCPHAAIRPFAVTKERGCFQRCCNRSAED